MGHSPHRKVVAGERKAHRVQSSCAALCALARWERQKDENIRYHTGRSAPRHCLNPLTQVYTAGGTNT